MENSAPLSIPANHARLSLLAVASLCITALCPFWAMLILFPLLYLLNVNGIWLYRLLPAILMTGVVCSHIAASRCKKSDGALQGKWLARVAYVFGYGYLFFMWRYLNIEQAFCFLVPKL